MRNVIGLFPTPFMRVEGAVPPDLLQALAERARQSQRAANVRDNLLSHTEMVDPRSDELFAQVSRTALPDIVKFGELMFGETLGWTVKEMWLNVLATNGSQFIHSHANSFVSGIVYVTPSHPSARTVFYRNLGGTEFIFKNDTNARMGQFNGDKWVLPEAKAGDLVLYPSYLLHGVPPNQGGERITVAMNAIPDRLKSWGYEIRFSR